MNVVVYTIALQRHPSVLFIDVACSEMRGLQ
ncbi:hypothetical protein A2U01_0094240, partial [Trifolium medium]|nr:hypothetical protein [Trifolium medium]